MTPPSRTALVPACVIGAFACAFAVVKPTNFAGFDEWLVLWLTTHGVLGAPYSNRPLNFLWPMPGAWLTPGFLGFHVMHMAYLAGTGLATRTLVRLVAPGQEELATIAGLAAAVFVPADMARLSSVQMTLVSGSTLGTMLALIGFVEAVNRRRPLLLAAAAALAFVTVRSYEATLAVLVAGPLLLSRALPGPYPRRLVIGWYAVLALAGALVVAPHLFGGRALYQTSIWGFDPRPLEVLHRLLRQFLFHLGPLVKPGLAALPSAAALAAAILGVLAVVLSPASPRDRDEPSASPSAGRALGRLILVGAGLSAAAYFPFTLSARLDAPHRSQMAAAPWIGIVLGAAVEAMGLLTFGRRRTLLAAGLAGWIVLVGAGRTAALQQAWDGQSRYPAQMRSLSDLMRLAPALEPHTLVVALEEGEPQVWPSVFGFRHAVQYLYRDRATGYVVDGLELMYPTRKTGEGLRTDTWPELRRPWGVEPTLHRYEELLVVRIAPGGALTLASTWPGSVLGGLPAGARYAPGERIRN